MTQQASCINLKGAANIIAQYLHYGINSILFQRGIYPPEEFEFKEEYSIPIMVSKNHKIQLFLKRVLGLVEEWLPEQKIQSVSLVLLDVLSRETVERWDFKISYEDDNHMDEHSQQLSNRSLKQIQSEIRSVMRQITSSVSFLPLIERRTTFDIFIEPKKTEFKKAPPSNWEWKSGLDLNIQNPQTVKMKSFTTGFDKVDTAVVYKLNED